MKEKTLSTTIVGIFLSAGLAATYLFLKRPFVSDSSHFGLDAFKIFVVLVLFFSVFDSAPRIYEKIFRRKAWFGIVPRSFTLLFLFWGLYLPNVDPVKETSFLVLLILLGFCSLDLFISRKDKARTDSRFLFIFPSLIAFFVISPMLLGIVLFYIFHDIAAVFYFFPRIYYLSCSSLECIFLLAIICSLLRSAVFNFTSELPE
ncbi:MAG: hypothetical protein PHC85_03085 [Candidatus Pacebacteria bacterium]|nr:hypothetical protein [Candidatus Paceibacterota bacterium]